MKDKELKKSSPKPKETSVVVAPIEPLIWVIRGQRIILDADLAQIYGVTTKRLNQQVKRNRKRFPDDFMFKLTRKESQSLQRSRLQFATLKRGQNIKYFPYAFTEHGAVMAANVLNSEHAVAMSVFVVRAFVKLREVLAESKELASKLDELERQLTDRLDLHEEAILKLFEQIKDLLNPPPHNRGNNASAFKREIYGHFILPVFRLRIMFTC